MRERNGGKRVKRKIKGPYSSLFRGCVEGGALHALYYCFIILMKNEKTWGKGDRE